MIRAIFLDIDGVMLPFGSHHDDRDAWKRRELADLYTKIGQPEPLLVLVSDWRYGMLDEAIDMLESSNYPTPLVLPRTIDNRDREKLILAAAGHLRLLDGEWVALDDCVPDREPFFQCRCGEGLTPKIIDRVVAYANGERAPEEWKPNWGDP